MLQIPAGQTPAFSASWSTAHCSLHGALRAANVDPNASYREGLFLFHWVLNAVLQAMTYGRRRADTRGQTPLLHNSMTENSARERRIMTETFPAFLLVVFMAH